MILTLDQFEVGALIAMAVTDGPATLRNVIETSDVVSRVPAMSHAVEGLIMAGMAAPAVESRYVLTGKAFRVYPQLKLICSEFYKNSI